MFMDSDHVWVQSVSQIEKWFLDNMNTALVQWFAKKQSTEKTLVFGAEFVTMQQDIDVLRGLRYKLRIIDIPISSPLYIYGTICQ